MELQMQNNTSKRTSLFSFHCWIWRLLSPAVWTLNVLSQSSTKKRSRALYIMIANLSKKEYVVEQTPWEAAVDCVQDALNLELGGMLRKNIWTQGNEENSEKYWRRILESTLKGLVERNHPRGILKKGSRGTLREIADKGKMHFETMDTWFTLSPAPICKCSFFYKIKPSRREDLLLKRRYILWPTDWWMAFL